MRQVIVLCEGFTEKAFVQEVMKPRYPQLRIHGVFIGKKAHRRGRGGDIRYARTRPDILATLKDRACYYCTTFLDYYALGKDFPAKEVTASIKSASDKAALIEKAVRDDVIAELGDGFNQMRFYPYLSMHEFEGPLFSDPVKLAHGLYKPDLLTQLQTIRASFATPEDINNDKATAPSKRLKELILDYDKVTGGNLAAMAVGLEAMEKECEHFRKWLTWFERVAC